MRKYILTIVMSVVSLSMMANSLTSGLVAHWPFDGNAKDKSGNGYDLSGSVSYTADRNGNEGAAANFGGSTTLTPPRGLHVANSMTFSVWCKPSGNVPSGKGESLSGTDGATMPVSQYVLYPSHGGEDSTGRAGVGFLVGKNGVIVIEHAHDYCPLPLVWYSSIGDNWTLVTITLSANSAPTLYVNGVRIKNGLTSSKKKFIGVPDDFILSYRPDYYWGTVIGNGVTIVSSSCGYNGLMDDFRIYNRALSDTEVNALYLLDIQTPFYTVSFNGNGGTGTMSAQTFEDGKKQKLSKNTFHKEGYVFQGWVTNSAERAELAAAGIIDVDYTDEQEITVDSDMTLYAVWAPVDCVIHFNANGGVFKDKDGNVVKVFDQHFTHGKTQRLFTDELTPVRMDGSGNKFLGWSRGTPDILSSYLLFDNRKEWTWNDDATEETFYAVWTTTVTVKFYNQETTAGDMSLLPSSLADHLRWSVDDGSSGGRKTLGCGESIEVCPGRRTIQLHCDDNYKWLAGKFGFAGHEPLLNMVNDTFELDIRNDLTDSLIWWSNPGPSTRTIFVMAEPVSGMGLEARVQFLCSSEIRESLRSSIRLEDVPFDDSKVRITIGRAGYNESGSIVSMNTGSMTGLEAYKLYPIPKGLYYIENVSYNVDTSDGAPYWGAVLDSSFHKRLFEVVDDGKLLQVTIRFDMFGGRDAVRVKLDPQGGECEKTEMWFEYSAGPYQPGPRIIHKLPKPKKEGVEFAGWFTAKSGGQWKHEGSDISSCTLFAHWTEMTREWMEENTRLLFPELAYLDIETAANTMSANGCKTIGECYALGINPEDPNDDLKITAFKMKGGKPEITLNHTKDGSGNSFEDRVKILGKKELTDAEWQEVPPKGNPAHRFFKVGVEMP